MYSVEYIVQNNDLKKHPEMLYMMTLLSPGYKV